jgi:glucose/arabinose dehydrogenase
MTMKPLDKIARAFLIVCLLSLTLVPNAQAFRGRGAAFAVGAAVGSSTAASGAAAASQQQTAAAQQQTAAAQQQTAAAQQQAAASQQQAAPSQQQAAPPPAVAAGSPLPLGTVVAALPGGCTNTPVDGVNYYYCGGNFYQAVYEGSALRYITVKPK